MDATTLRYQNEEEFLALVVTNVYLSKKKGNLRRCLAPGEEAEEKSLASPINQR